MMITPATRRRAASFLALALLALTGCAAAGSPTADTAAGAAADEVTISDAWVKAAESGMTAGFGVLRNDGDTEVTVVAAAAAVAPRLELHETVTDEHGQQVMREVDGGFVIPGGGTLTLEPGGSHLMLMDLRAPLAPGEDVSITLTFDDGSTAEVLAPVKEYAGANENYDQGHPETGH